MQGATGSGVLGLTDNEDSNSSDERNPRVGLAITELSVDKVTSYSEVARGKAPVEGNISE